MAKRDLTPYTIKGYAQGTDYTIIYYAADSLVAKYMVDSILAEIDHSMSLYRPFSLINRINSGGNGPFEIDDHFYRVLSKSFKIHRDSKGIFDVTVAPLVQIWGFGPEAIHRFPDSTEVHRTLAHVGMKKLQLKGRRLKKRDASVQVDLNGIAQGYSVDVLAELLESRGITQYIVELGGELRIQGPKPDGIPMRVGIERPADKQSGGVMVNDVMTIREGAVTTAGNYRKYLQAGERKVSHHIDPKTGFPFYTDVISATVYAADAMTADGYDNVMMAMTAREAVRFAERRKGLEVFIIYRHRDGTIRDTMSTGFNKLITN